MNMSKKVKRMKQNRNGFTLVELIVVLVILAILAAILVPALLGWIDKAKEKQYVLNARSVYMAAQAKASEKYASDQAGAPLPCTFNKDDTDEIIAIADVSGLDREFSIQWKGTSGHDAYIIEKMMIEIDDVSCFLNNDVWSIDAVATFDDMDRVTFSDTETVPAP